MRIEVKQTDEIGFSPGYPKSVLESFIANTSSIHRNACILALSSVVRSKGVMEVSEESFERVCNLFESIVLYFLDNCEEDTSGDWGPAKSEVFLKAYLYVTERHHSAKPFNASGVREGPTWLPRAVSFMVSSIVGLPDDKAVLSKTEALKTVIHYANIGGVLSQEEFENYLHGILLEFYERVKFASPLFRFCGEDEWQPIERILRLMIGRSYFPPRMVETVSKLRAQIHLPRQPNVFKQDACFKEALFEKASHQLAYVLSLTRRQTR
jgi:hypothetical protein